MKVSTLCDLMPKYNQSSLYPRLSTFSGTSDDGVLEQYHSKFCLPQSYNSLICKFKLTQSFNPKITKVPGLRALYKEIGTLLLNKDKASQ